MGNHGFARHSIFEITMQSSDSVTLSIKTTDEQFPFKLQFNVTYSLVKNKLFNKFEVINLGESVASCGFGAHPAFACPFDSSHNLTDYEITFDGTQQLDFHPITLDAFYKGESEVQHLSNIQINGHAFDKDALVYSGFSSKKVRLTEKGSSRYIEVVFDDFEYLGLWSKPKAEYVCIEPWCGRSDTLGKICDIDNRIGNFNVEQKGSFKQTYSIEFGY